jgi:hypothetical protein
VQIIFYNYGLNPRIHLGILSEGGLRKKKGAGARENRSGRLCFGVGSPRIKNKSTRNSKAQKRINTTNRCEIKRAESNIADLQDNCKSALQKNQRFF